MVEPTIHVRDERREYVFMVLREYLIIFLSYHELTRQEVSIVGGSGSHVMPPLVTLSSSTLQFNRLELL